MVFTPRTVGPEGVLSSPSCAFLRKVKNALTWKIIIGSLYFLCEVTHEYGDHLIRFSALQL